MDQVRRRIAEDYAMHIHVGRLYSPAKAIWPAPGQQSVRPTTAIAANCRSAAREALRSQPAVGISSCPYITGHTAVCLNHPATTGSYTVLFVGSVGGF